MSTTHQPAKNRPVTTDDDAWPDRDAYAIAIPDSFKEAYPTADTAAEALRQAERAPPATDGDEHTYQDLTDLDGTTTATTGAGGREEARCVRCGSRRLSPKGNDTQSTKRTDGYVCDNCRTHQSDPDNPELSEIAFSDDQVQLGRFDDEQ